MRMDIVVHRKLVTEEHSSVVGGTEMVLKNRALEKLMAVAMDSGTKTVAVENICHGQEPEKPIDVAG